MPGSIRVSVLESVDLPAEATGGNYVSIKVAVGKREFQTQPRKADGNKTAAWNSEFVFPLLNLRDNLMVVLLDNKGNAVAQTDIETPFIVKKGFWDGLFPLKGGGRIHLSLSFVLTEEERKRIEAMRATAMKRKEHGILKKNARIQVLRPAARNGKGTSVSSMGIPQSIPEDLQNREASDNMENQVAVPVVSQVSQINDAQFKIESIQEASRESPVTSTSSAFEPANNEEVSIQKSKNTSGHHLPKHGHEDLPQHRWEETGTSLPSEESIPSKELPSLSSQIFSPFEEARDAAVMQVDTTVLNQDLQPALLPAEGSLNEGHADFEYVEPCDVIDKPQIIKNGKIKVEEEGMPAKHQDSVVVPVISSSQNLAAIQGSQKIDAPGSPLHLADAALTPKTKMTSTGSLSHFESLHTSDSDDSASELHTESEASSAPLSESTSAFVNDKSANLVSLKYSNEEDITLSCLFTSSAPLRSSREGSISPTPLVDIPPDVAGESIPFPPISPMRSRADPVFQTHESAILAEPPPVSLVYKPTISEENNVLESHSDPAVGSGLMIGSEEMCIAQPLSSAENKNFFAQDLCPIQSKKDDSLDTMATAIGSLADSTAEVLHKDFSLQTQKGIAKSVSSSAINLPDNFDNVPTSLASVIKSLADTVTSASTCSLSPSAAQTLKESGAQSSVKAKIKAFENNLSQDSHHYSSPPLKSQDHKIEAERAVQRLRAEAAAAEAAEARRRAEEAEARLKSIAEEESRKLALQQGLEESRFRRATKVEKKYQGKNEGETKREIQKEIKEITIAEGDLRTQQVCRRKAKARQEIEEKRPRVCDREKKHVVVESADSVYKAVVHEVSAAGRESSKPDGNTQMEDAIASKRRLEEQGKYLSRTTEIKGQPTEEDPRKNALIWETMRLGELQLKRKQLGGTLKSEVSAKKSEVGEKSSIDTSAEASWTGKTFEEKQDLEVPVAKSQLMKDDARRFVAEASQITADKRKSEELSTNIERKEFASSIERNRALQFTEFVEFSEVDAKDKAKQRQGNEHDILFDQRLQSMITGNTFVQDTSCEEGSIISEEEELEDLLKSSKAFGGFIKQALGAAAVLAAGALFMWLRGERMNKRRANTTQPKERQYFQQKGEASSRILPEQSEEADLSISKPKSKVVEIEEITNSNYPHQEIFLENMRWSYRHDDLGDQLCIQSKDGSSLTTFPNSLTMTIDLPSISKMHGLTWQEVQQVVGPDMVLSIYNGEILKGGNLQISSFTHPKMCQLASPIYEQIYGDEPYGQKVPMYFAMQLYAHLILGYKVDFRSMPKEVHASDRDDGILNKIAHNAKNDHEHMLNSNVVINAPHDICGQRTQSLIEEKNHLESIVQRERQHLRTLVHAFCVITERARRDIDMARCELIGLINTRDDLEKSLKNIELQLRHAYLDNLDILEAQRSRVVAQVGDVMQQTRATTTWMLELQGHIRDHRDQALQTLMFVRQIEMRCRLVHQELDMLLGGMQGHSREFLYNQFLLMPYYRGNIKPHNLEATTYIDLHKPSCSVCLSSLQHDGFYGLQCGHLHHFSCLLVHIIGQNKCAMCREEISFETYLSLGIEDFIPSGQILDEVGLPLDCTPKKYL